MVGCGESKEALEPSVTPKATPEKETRNPELPKAAAWVSDPNDPNNVKIEKAIRYELYSHTGELTKADLEKVTQLTFPESKLTDVKDLEKLTQLTFLDLSNNKLTDVKGLENLTRLTDLRLGNNPALTKAQIAGLKKALPKCNIRSNPTK